MTSMTNVTLFRHANFLRQCSLLGETLVVGVHSDEEIAANKVFIYCSLI